MKKGKKTPVFKPYNPHQLLFLPPSLEELIPSNHVVRLVQKIVDELNIDSILSRYKGGGTSSFHPRLLLKVLIYGYLSNIYSSRKLEAATRSNIHFMWLCGMTSPDHNTINRFRSEKLKGLLKDVFSQVVELMLDSELVSLKKVYVDGTKLEANANKYTFVWGKSIANYKENIKQQLADLWSYAEGVAAGEMKDNRPTTFESIDSKKVEQTIEQINKALKGKEVDKKIEQKLKYGKKNWPQNLDRYKKQESILKGRGSYSKTDPDATFMRMKDDHMKNGQLKAGYNWQISTENQFILNYDIFCNPNDTLTLPAHMNNFQQLYGQLPCVVVADAGYGSEENYEYLEKGEMEAYVKYNYFHKEQRLKGKPDPKKPFHPDYLYYNKKGDYLVCPMGQRMEKQGKKTSKTASGFVQKYSVYQAKNCRGCPLRSRCHKSKENRTIQLNHNLKRLKTKARKLLTSEQGLKHRSQRPVDVEAVFGNIKQNKKIRRFNLRGNEKVLIEAGLLSIAHNIAKIAKLENNAA